MPKRLTLFAPVLLAVVLSIGIMAWFGYHNAKDILEQELVAHQKMIAQSAVDAIHTYFTGITENVETLAASGPIRRLLKNPDSAEEMDSARRLTRLFIRHQSDMPNLNLLNKNGQIILSSTTAMPGITRSVRTDSSDIDPTIDLCGQHEHQQLMKTSQHVRMLDAWAGDAVVQARTAYEEAFATANAAANASVKLSSSLIWKIFCKAGNAQPPSLRATAISTSSTHKAKCWPHGTARRLQTTC